MKANELMIGDYIETIHGITIVENITESGINGEFDKYWNQYFFDATQENEKISPILLTLKWFEKNEIEIQYLNGNNHLMYQVAHEADKFHYVIGANANDFGDWLYTTKEIKFVHQLQQLVRIFENREITIK